MSGIDLHGMVNQAHSRAQYVQNNVLKSSAIDSNQSPSNYGINEYANHGQQPVITSANDFGASTKANPHHMVSENVAEYGNAFTPNVLSHVVSQQ